MKHRISQGTANLITEAAWQRVVTEALTRYHWIVYHTRDSRGSRRGYPDLTAAHVIHGVIFAELKSERGRLRPEQREWLNTLSHTQRTYLWRPSGHADVLAVAKGDFDDPVEWVRG
jgi:hypothetical protein